MDSIYIDGDDSFAEIYDSYITGDESMVDGTVTIRGCLFNASGSNSHIIDFTATSDGTIMSCIFKSMANDKAGLILRAGSAINVSGCTFVGASNVGWGLFIANGATVNNCIVTDLDVGVYESGAFTVTTNNFCFYDNTSAVSGTVTQNDSQTGDPKLNNVAGNDFSLQAGSSCIGTGKDLGDTYDHPIDTVSWGDGSTTVPSVTYGVQPVSWDIGAYIY